MKEKKYEAVVFDVDDTIRNYTLQDQLILEKTQKDLKVKLSFRLLIVKLIELVALYFRSFGILKADMKTLDLRLKLHAIILNVDVESYKELYYQNANDIVIPFANTKETLEHLRSNNYKIYIATNNPKAAHFCKSMGFSKEYIFVTKSNNRKLDTIKGLIAKETLEANKVLVVGDSLLEDIKSANTLNIDSAWLNYNNRLKTFFTRFIRPTVTLNDIIDLKDLL